MAKRSHPLSINTQIRFLTGVAFITFLFLCLLIYKNTRQMLIRNADNYSSLINRRLETELSFTTDTVQNVLQNIQAEPDFARLLAYPYSEKNDLVNGVRNRIVNYSILNPQIYDISLVSDTVHFSNLYSYAELDRMRASLKASVSGFIGIKTTDFYHLANWMDEPLLVYGSVLKLDGKEAGVVFISMRSASITTNFSEDEAIGSYFLLSNDDTVVYPFNCTQEEAEGLLSSFKASEGGPADGFRFRSTRLAKMNCELLCALDLTGPGYDLHDITLPIWISVGLICVWILCIFGVMSHNLVAPLNQFTKAIQEIRKSHSRNIPRPIVLGGCQELSIIGMEFTEMMRNIQHLNTQIFQTTSNLYEAKVQKQEAEISYLRSQVDPHFLYNTLEVIRRMAIERDAPEISAITMDISRIFRYSAKGDALVGLEDELRILEAYIHIQQARFQKKIDVICHFPENTLHLKVIKMLLQPLVENAIFHGLEPKNGIGTLYLAAKRDENRLTVKIRDDGIGIPESELNTIRTELASQVYDTSRHMGIINTHARIQLQYGKEYGLEIDSTPDDGTNITLCLPVVE